MAGFRQIAGDGYGSAYIDGLIAGGAVWDTRFEPLTIAYGNKQERTEWINYHGDPKIDSTGFNYLPNANLMNSFVAGTWSGKDLRVMPNVINEIQRITSINLVANLVEDEREARTDNLIIWKTDLPNSSAGTVWASADTPAETAKRQNPQSWLYVNTIDEGSWSYPHMGGMGFMMMLNMFGSALGLEQAYLGFPGVTSAYDPGPLGLNQAPFTVMSANWSYQGSGDPYGKWAP